MSLLLDFYRGVGRDTEGRTLDEVWSFSDDEMELTHDFIQWLFPLREPSRFNPDAPLLVPRDIDAFRRDVELRGRLVRSLDRFLQFVGLTRDEGAVGRAGNFAARRSVWVFPNHNWLRITRVLTCLSILGMEAEAMAFFEELKRLYESGETAITGETFTYWENAVRPRDR